MSRGYSPEKPLEPPEDEGRPVRVYEPGALAQTTPSQPGDFDGYCWEGYYRADDNLFGVTSWKWLDAGWHWFHEGLYYNHYTGRQEEWEAGWWKHPAGWEAWSWYNLDMAEYWSMGPWDWGQLFWHERSHQAGFQHWEATPRVNGAYYPTGPVCGC